MKLYAYQQDVRKAYSIHEQGTSYLLSPEEGLSGSETAHYEIDYTLIGTVEVYDCFEYEGRLLSFQILEGGEEHKSPELLSGNEFDYRDINELFQKTPHFTVAETAGMLGVSEQRIRALIDVRQLRAQKKAGVWLLSGLDILAFSLKERPAHRPKKSGLEEVQE